MKMVFVSSIIRNSLCIIYGFYIVYFKNHFLLKIIFWLLRSILLPGVHCILVLFCFTNHNMKYYFVSNKNDKQYQLSLWYKIIDKHTVQNKLTVHIFMPNLWLLREVIIPIIGSDSLFKLSWIFRLGGHTPWKSLSLF